MSESGSVRVDGGQVFYTCDGEGPPVVLLHGAFCDHRLFDAQVEALSQHHTLVRMDLRGYGQSSVPGSQTYRHCDDVVAVIDALGFGRVVVGGESFGGGVALDFAFAHPNRVAGLIFDAGVSSRGWQWLGDPGVQAIFEAALTDGLPAARQVLLGGEVLASAMAHPEVAAALTDMVDDYSGWHFANTDPVDWAQDNAMGRLEEIKCPALVVIGGHDVLDFRMMGEALAERLPNATRHFWPDSGHMPNMEEPARFNELVIEFLNNVYPAAGR